MSAPAGQLPRGRHKLSRAEVAGVQRERMLRAMAEEMAERGYVGTPVAAIIKRAGVSRETFYQQFSSKQDCFVAALEEALAHLSVEMDRAPADGTPIQRFERVITVYLDALARDPAIARLFLIEIYAAGPDVMRRRVELQQRFVDRLVTMLGARGAQGRFACQALVAAIVNLVTMRLAGGDVDGLRELRTPLVRLVRQALESTAPAELPLDEAR